MKALRSFRLTAGAGVVGCWLPYVACAALCLPGMGVIMFAPLTA